MKMQILDRINKPSDLKALNKGELEHLAQQIREAIIERVGAIGGHLGPNLGVVEMTIALHYVFNSPIDKIVYDISHQCYPHKMLTGRKEAFTNLEKYKTVTGFTAPEESEHDFFTIGHTSTSISLACGLAKARDIKGDNENIIAVIGDGSLSGGQAYEGLNNAAASGKNIIIVVNDNDMSIAENHGGLYQNLAKLRETRGKAENNFFKALGLDYYYIEEGNDVEALIDGFSKVKDIDHPVVVHVHTTKGKGYQEAEENKESFHWSQPFNLENKATLTNGMPIETYHTIVGDYLLEKAKQDPKVVAITAGTPGSVAVNRVRKELSEQYIDVGIAEEHAVALISGMASQGTKPVFSVLSSFIQRTYDQLSQDLAINHNPAVLLVFGGGITGSGVTHLGNFDIPLISKIPNIIYLAPTNKEELKAMMEWGIDQTQWPVAIRVPSMPVVETGKVIEADFSKLNVYEKTIDGSEVAIVGLGSFYHLGQQVQETLKVEKGIKATLINPRFITGVDKALLNNLIKDHKLIITLEDGALDGGFGEMITRFYGDKDIKVLNFGATKEFTDNVPLEELKERYHLTPELIVSDIIKVLGQ
ncbi:MAG: 1-deoxy-D-xylulose-5-phosphate synthase [Cellulosilyticum sp.]|nr:1-deoxy-D-xylulose-5-phosphate synthase [Cellulosilyticum sp.]